MIFWPRKRLTRRFNAIGVLEGVDKMKGSRLYDAVSLVVNPVIMHELVKRL
jgi:hypothetical protein